jgi:integrase
MTRAWSESVGSYGYTVTVTTRPGRPNLYLRFYDPAIGRKRWESLKHNDRERALEEARARAGQRLAEGHALATGRLTIGVLFARYERERSKHKKGTQLEDDRRRMDVWEAFLGAEREVRTIAWTDLDRFDTVRRRGELQVPWKRARVDEERPPFRALAKRPSRGTIGADIVFLQTVLNWATNTMLPDGTRLLVENPIRRYAVPKTARPRRPVATYDRFLAIHKVADQVDPQKRFGSFLDLIEALGWRVSAICQLRGEDVDRRKRAGAPFGRLHKRGNADKEGADMWIPLPEAARKAIDRLPVIAGWLFPAPRRKDKPWRRQHARDLLEAAEAAAELEPLEGGDFHPYRRKWATERKHLPDADVMAAGGWSDSRSLKQSYQQIDDETLLAVVTEPRKLREAK